MSDRHAGPAAEEPAVDLAAYFARIAYAGPTDPTLETLAELVAAHTRHIPFENLDPSPASGRCPQVDVGFGGQTLTSPIRLTAGPIQQTRHEPFRLRSHDRGYVLEALVPDSWQPLYTFTTEPRPLIDMQVGSWTSQPIRGRTSSSG